MTGIGYKNFIFYHTAGDAAGQVKLTWTATTPSDSEVILSCSFNGGAFTEATSATWMNVVDADSAAIDGWVEISIQVRLIDARNGESPTLDTFTFETQNFSGYSADVMRFDPDMEGDLGSEISYDFPSLTEWTLQFQVKLANVDAGYVILSLMDTNGYLINLTTTGSDVYDLNIMSDDYTDAFGDSPHSLTADYVLITLRVTDVTFDIYANEYQVHGLATADYAGLQSLSKIYFGGYADA